MAKRQDADREVLTSLPRSRPVRRSAKRGERADTASGGVSAQTRRAPAAKPRAAKAATATTTKPKPAAGKATPKARPKPAAKAPRPPAAPRRKVPPAGYATPSARADDARAAGGGDLLGTAVQAVSELAQIGLTVGRQTLQSMLDRLPKP